MAINYPVALQAATQADIELVKIKTAISALIAGQIIPGVEVPVELNAHVAAIQDNIKGKVDEIKALLTIVKDNIK